MHKKSRGDTRRRPMRESRTLGSNPDLATDDQRRPWLLAWLQHPNNDFARM